MHGGLFSAPVLGDGHRAVPPLPSRHRATPCRRARNGHGGSDWKGETVFPSREEWGCAQPGALSVLYSPSTAASSCSVVVANRPPDRR